MNHNYLNNKFLYSNAIYFNSNNASNVIDSMYDSTYNNNSSNNQII